PFPCSASFKCFFCVIFPGPSIPSKAVRSAGSLSSPNILFSRDAELIPSPIALYLDIVYILQSLNDVNDNDRGIIGVTTSKVYADRRRTDSGEGVLHGKFRPIRI